jgi:hypothetical protein
VSVPTLPIPPAGIDILISGTVIHATGSNNQLSLQTDSPGIIRARGIVTDSCGSVTTAPVSLVVRACPSGPCPADYDGSGGTPEAGDINAFFVDWLAGADCADTDCSGGTPDSSDIDTFFAAWLAGGC